MKELLELSARNQQIAWNIINDTKIIEIWESIGATINLVGSLKTGLMCKNRDIDFHVYTSPFTLTDSFMAISKLAEHPSIKRIEYNNFLEEEDACISWTVWTEDREGNLWHIDIIHIIRGSRYDGYFERVAERISAVLTDEMKNIILQLKCQTPDDQKIMGVEYYRAVIEGGVRTYEQLEEWRVNNPAEGVVEWIP